MSRKDRRSAIPVIFEQGKDPGVGQLRVVWNLDKMEKVAASRALSFGEIYEVMFSMGRSTFLKVDHVSIEVEGRKVIERRFKIIGLTNSDKPIVVVFTPRDEFGQAKRIITAWQASRKSQEYKKLMRNCPQLTRMQLRPGNPRST